MEVKWAGIQAALRLSRRETEIVAAISEGQKDSTIAQRMGIARCTLRTYIGRLYHKLGVNRRAELMVLVFEVRLRLASEAVAEPADGDPRPASLGEVTPKMSSQRMTSSKMTSQRMTSKKMTSGKMTSRKMTCTGQNRKDDSDDAV